MVSRNWNFLPKIYHKTFQKLLLTKVISSTISITSMPLVCANIELVQVQRKLIHATIFQCAIGTLIVLLLMIFQNYRY